MPLLTAANWGGQGLHTRGNFEGFSRAASAQKWLEVHGLEHWTHFYTDYGVGPAEAVLRLLPARRRPRLAGPAPGPAAGPHAGRVHPAWRAGVAAGPDPLERLYLWPDSEPLDPAAARADDARAYAADGDGVTFTAPPLGRRHEITGPAAARLFVSSTMHRRRPVPACCGCSRRTARR